MRECSWGNVPQRVHWRADVSRDALMNVGWYCVCVFIVQWLLKSFRKDFSPKSPSWRNVSSRRTFGRSWIAAFSSISYTCVNIAAASAQGLQASALLSLRSLQEMAKFEFASAPLGRNIFEDTRAWAWSPISRQAGEAAEDNDDMIYTS